MPSLRQFQSAFIDALQGSGAALEPWLEQSLEATPGLAVYRNTVTRGAIDVLAATFSTVVRMVGEDWFRAAAAAYVASHRPSTPVLHRYGANFPEWLVTFPPGADAPYLPAIAQLDWLWWEACFAADAQSLGLEALTQLDDEGVRNRTLDLHPSVRLARFDHNVVSLWLTHRDSIDPGEFGIVPAIECALIVRKELQVKAVLISPSSHAFLAACRNGASLMSAAAKALAMEPGASLPAIIGEVMAAGVATGLAQSQSGASDDQ